MKKFKKKGFTLIELIAVLVIMAIIALIVTPLVMNIIRKAKISADKRSVDAYGRSIELAIAGYLLDTGKFATSIDELTIEYSGNKVECETTQINPDSSVYLSNCKVNNREVTNYTYGTDKSPSYEAYNVGDEVTYNGVDYYVLKDSGTKDNVVTLLKATPLTTEEVNTYGGEYVNKYTYNRRGEAYDRNGYGAVAYFSSEECTDGQYPIKSGCTNDYEQSDIKHIVDGWIKANSEKNDLINSRLINTEDLENLGYQWVTQKRYGILQTFLEKPNIIPDGIYIDYRYWTMIVKDSAEVERMQEDGYLSGKSSSYVYDNYFVRPVVELYKNDGITRKNSGNN